MTSRVGDPKSPQEPSVTSTPDVPKVATEIPPPPAEPTPVVADALVADEPSRPSLTPAPPARPVVLEPAVSGVNLRQPGGLTNSILNPRGAGNVSGRDPLWDNLNMGRTDANSRTQPRVDDRNLVADPNRVMNQGVRPMAHPDIQRIVASREGAPRTGELVAQKLAELYGPFTADNSAANRNAILSNILWVADTNTGIQYDHPRAAASGTDTYAPNHTLSTRSGVCRDIHTATSAILASLMTAKQEGGRWVPGSPTGQESRVQTIGFNNPSEFHAYMVYRDPTTGSWNALEYGRHYTLNSPNALDAFRNLPGYMSGYTRYTLRGWDQNPVVNDRGSVSAARANEFFEYDPGVGQKNEVRTNLAIDDIRLTYFATPRLSIVGSIDPQALSNGLRGGIKLNYHKDLEGVGDQSVGYYRAALGVYTDFFDASEYTGWRGVDDRTRYHVFVLGAQFDGRRETEKYKLLGDHLTARLGADWNLRLGLPLASGLNANTFMPGALSDYSRGDVGGDAALGGHEDLGGNVELDWALRLRAQVDLINAGTELITSGGETASRSLLKDPLRSDFALALTHRPPGGLTTRFEVGGTQFFASPYDSQTAASQTHYAAFSLSPQSGWLNFGIIARGETLDRRFIPVDAIGATLNITPNPNLTLGLGVESSMPGGDWKKFGERLQVHLGATIRF